MDDFSIRVIVADDHPAIVDGLKASGEGSSIELGVMVRSVCLLAGAGLAGCPIERRPA